MFTDILFNLLDFSILIKIVLNLSCLTEAYFDIIGSNWVAEIEEVNSKTD